MCAEPPARGRHHLRAHGQRLVRLHGVRRRRVRPSDRGMGVRHDHEHAGAAVAGVGAGDLMGRVPRRHGWSYPPQRPWHAVHRHGVHHQGYGIWDAAVDRHRRRLVRQRHGRKRRRRVQDRAGMAAQTLRGSEGPGIGDVPVGLVVELEAAPPVPGLQDTRSGGNRVSCKPSGTSRLTIRAEQKSSHFNKMIKGIVEWREDVTDGIDQPDVSGVDKHCDEKNSDREPIRVAQIVGKMLGGGVEAVVMNYYRHIDRSKVQFDFLVDEDSTRVPEDEITALGGRIFRIPPYQHPIRYRRELIRLMREQRWPIVHSNINTLSVFPLSAAKRVGVPVRIAHSHSTMGKGEFAKNAMKLVLRPFANVYPTARFACSRYAGKWLFGKNADFTVIPNAIELDKFRFNAETRKQTRKELGISDDMFLIGHVGRFMPQKNQSFLVDVLAGLLPKRPDVMLAFVGDGPDRTAVQQHVEELGIVDHVLFLGQRSDVNRLYQAFDVFCLPSLYEGLCVVGIEAQRAGLPCLFSDAITREVDVTGASRFMPITSPEEWISFISAIESGTRISSSEKVFSDYDISENAQKLTSMYLRLFEKK